MHARLPGARVGAVWLLRFSMPSPCPRPTLIPALSLARPRGTPTLLLLSPRTRLPEGPRQCNAARFTVSHLGPSPPPHTRLEVFHKHSSVMPALPLPCASRQYVRSQQHVSVLEDRVSGLTEEVARGQGALMQVNEEKAAAEAATQVMHFVCAHA